MPSKRRERELARQRYERRQREARLRRARQRRRNVVTAAVVVILLVLSGAAYGISLLVGGGSTPSAAPSASASPQPTLPGAPTTCAAIKPNPPKAGQPSVPSVPGRAPTTLVVKDVTKGTGATAKQGSSLSVTYIGISCSTGTVFDASYLHGNQPFTVSPLGTAGVIDGWNKGLIGVRAGGVRELVIPAALGYGEQGSGQIKPNETLIFLVTVKSVTG